MDDLYQEIILEHYRHPHNVGVLTAHKNNVTLCESNVGCGDELTVALQLDEAKKKIKDIKWQGTGCAISTASISVVSDFIKGKTIAEVLNLTQNDVLELLGLKEITVGREKCLMLGVKAIQKILLKKDEIK